MTTRYRTDAELDAEDLGTPEEIAQAQAENEARDYRSIAAASNLIAERISGRFTILDDVGHGVIFPDDTEEVSGAVLDERGDLYAFWTDWDADAGQLVLRIWRREPLDEVAERWRKSSTYRWARAQVGLSSDT